MTIGVSGFKKGERVPPGATFTYTWQTFGWLTTAGAWLYHDHSICDMENVQQGAIGIIVIRNPADPEDDTDLDVPGASFNGLPTLVRCFPLPFPVSPSPHDLDTLGLHGNMPHSHGGSPMARPAPTPLPAPVEPDDPKPALIARHGDLLLEFDPEFTQLARPWV